MDEQFVTEHSLNLTELADIAVATGADMGFNAVEVQLIANPDAGRSLRFLWGDRETMGAPRIRPPMAYCFSYMNDVECTRAPRNLVLPEDAASKSVDWLRGRFSEALLELADG